MESSKHCTKLAQKAQFFKAFKNRSKFYVIATYISDTNVLILFLTKNKGTFLNLERIQSQAFKPDNLIPSYY